MNKFKENSCIVLYLLYNESHTKQTTYKELEMITPYKGRVIDYTKTVMIYKNLTNGLWSIKQGGKVVGHANCFLLRSTEFKVYEATRQRVIAERKKYVHAYVIGYLDPKCPLDLEVLELDKRIVYNPYKSGSFCFVTNDYLTPIKNDGSMYYIHGGNGLGHLHLVKYSA